MTIVIGGMIKNEKHVNQLGVPIISRIPLFGRLFRTDISKDVKTETIVFLTPKIITGEEPFLQLPDEGRESPQARPVAGTAGTKPGWAGELKTRK